MGKVSVNVGSDGSRVTAAYDDVKSDGIIDDKEKERALAALKRQFEIISSKGFKTDFGDYGEQRKISDLTPLFSHIEISESKDTYWGLSSEVTREVFDGDSISPGWNSSMLKLFAPPKPKSSISLTGTPFTEQELEFLLDQLKRPLPPKDLEELKKKYPSRLIDALKKKLKDDKEYSLSKGDFNSFQKNYARPFSGAEQATFKELADRGDRAAQFLLIVGGDPARKEEDQVKAFYARINEYLKANPKVPWIDGNQVKKWVKGEDLPMDLAYVMPNEKFPEDFKRVLGRSPHAAIAKDILEWAEDIAETIQLVHDKEHMIKQYPPGEERYSAKADWEKMNYDKKKLDKQNVKFMTKLLKEYYKDDKFEDKDTYNQIASFMNVLMAYRFARGDRI